MKSVGNNAGRTTHEILKSKIMWVSTAREKQKTTTGNGNPVVEMQLQLIKHRPAVFEDRNLPDTAVRKDAGQVFVV